MKFTFQLTPSLTATLFGSYSYTSDENDNFKPTWVWAQGQASRYESKREDCLGHVMLDYQHTWGKHHLEAKAMAEYQSSNTNGFGTLVKGFANNVVSFYDLQAGYLMPFGGTTADYINTSLMSFLGQVDYRLMDRYTLSVNARADGSSLFADGNKWAVFPSVSLVWNMKQENFMKHIDWLSQLDVRAGYGISGNLGGVEAYNSLSLLNPSGLIPWKGSMVTTYNITNNANPNLKWESRGTFNIGADMALWNNKLVLKAECVAGSKTVLRLMSAIGIVRISYSDLNTRYPLTGDTPTVDDRAGDAGQSQLVGAVIFGAVVRIGQGETVSMIPDVSIGQFEAAAWLPAMGAIVWRLHF